MMNSQNQGIYAKYNFKLNCDDFILKSIVYNNKQLDSLTRFYSAPTDSFTREKKLIVTKLFKNLKGNVYFEQVGLFGAKGILSEKLNLFNWKVTSRTKKILNYTCQEAKTHYRGRDFTAYFTTELSVKYAPWKFHGLPGVILEVSSSDGEILLEIEEISIKAVPISIQNPFKKSDFNSWENYVKKFKSQIENANALARRSNSSFKGMIPSCGTNIEIIHWNK